MLMAVQLNILKRNLISLRKFLIDFFSKHIDYVTQCLK